MTAKEYLCRLKELDTKIRQRQQQKEELRQKMLSPGRASDEKVRKSQSDRMAEREHAYEKIKKDIDKSLERYLAEKNRIISQIHRLTNERYVQVLYLHYVPDGNGRTRSMERIADIMTKPNGGYYSIEHIRTLHWKALKEFEKILKQNRNQK